MSQENPRIDPRLAGEISRSCVSFNLRKSARLVSHAYDQAFSELGIKSTQFSVMMGTAIQKKASIKNMAKALGMDRSTLSRNARLLASKGLIQLMDGEDRREQLIALTESGWEMLEKAIPVWQQTQAGLESEFGAEWLDGLLNRLKELNRRLP